MTTRRRLDLSETEQARLADSLTDFKARLDALGPLEPAGLGLADMAPGAPPRRPRPSTCSFTPISAPKKSRSPRT
jgi:hypothetical protein